MYRTSQILIFITLLISFAAVSNIAVAQNKAATEQLKPQKGKIKSEGEIQKELIFEEIQRYLGYETLPVRYLSLPYDVTMNANVDAYYVEIGFLMLMFIPLILVIGFRKKPMLGFLVMGLSLFLLLISTSNGILMKNKLIRTAVNAQTLESEFNEVSFKDAPVDYLMISFYKVTSNLYQPIENFLLTFSGKSDYVTYPLLIICFIALFLIVNSFLKNHEPLKRILVLAALLFAFLWMMLAAGIIWYGYLIMALAFVFIFSFFSKKDRFKGHIKYLRYTFVGIILLWLGLTLVLRISNIYILDQSAGIHIFDAPIVKYQFGEKNNKGKRFAKDDLIQNYFPGLNKALKGINKREDNYVYSIGTMFPYFIKKNNQRIFNDNLLALFQAILDRYNNDKIEVVKVLKSFGFKYILINLKLHKIDKTPEKSVTKKYINFMNFANQNPTIDLVATDRIIKVDNKLSYGLFGDIQNEGSYAIFKIK